MRSIAELKFRARQEAANLRLLLSAAALHGRGAAASWRFPIREAVADALRGSAYRTFVEATAERILAHRFPLLGVTVETGPAIRWRRDYRHGKESGIEYFRRIPYLNFSVVGDHKFIWELNRHQHLVLLAQAYVLTGRKEYPHEIWAQIESWLEQNPFQRGINWASALRGSLPHALLDLALSSDCGAMPEDFRRRFLTALYRHGHHLAENLSIYFSPNTHLLGEAVALHALGVLFPVFPESERWRARGAAIVEAQLEFQVKADGSHFEQSTYYHVYALDFFLFYYLMASRPKHFEPALARMAEYLDWLLGPARRMALLGRRRRRQAVSSLRRTRSIWPRNSDDVRHSARERSMDRFARDNRRTSGLVAGSGMSLPRRAPGKRPRREAVCSRTSGMVFLQSGDLFVNSTRDRSGGAARDTVTPTR